MNSRLNKDGEKSDQAIPLIRCLTECDKGEEVKVLRVNAGLHAKRRLSNLGVIPGVFIVKKKSAPWRGPVEIIVKGSDLVIGRGLAAKIMVLCNGNCEL